MDEQPLIKAIEVHYKQIDATWYAVTVKITENYRAQVELKLIGSHDDFINMHQPLNKNA